MIKANKSNKHCDFVFVLLINEWILLNCVPVVKTLVTQNLPYVSLLMDEWGKGLEWKQQIGVGEETVGGNSWRDS